MTPTTHNDATDNLIVASRKTLRFLNDLLFQTGRTLADKTTGEVLYPADITTGTDADGEPVKQTITRVPLDEPLPHVVASGLIRSLQNEPALPATEQQIASALKMAALLRESLDVDDLASMTRRDLDLIKRRYGAIINKQQTEAADAAGYSGITLA